VAGAGLVRTHIHTWSATDIIAATGGFSNAFGRPEEPVALNNRTRLANVKSQAIVDAAATTPEFPTDRWAD